MSETYFTSDGTELDDSDLHERYDDWLDEDGDVQIAGFSYAASSTLEQIDPVAYRRGFSDWLDMQLDCGTIFDTAPEELEFEVGDKVREIDTGEVFTIRKLDPADRELPYGATDANGGEDNWFGPGEIEAEQASPFQVVGIIFVQVEG